MGRPTTTTSEPQQREEETLATTTWRWYTLPTRTTMTEREMERSPKSAAATAMEPDTPMQMSSVLANSNSMTNPKGSLRMA